MGKHTDDIGRAAAIVATVQSENKALRAELAERNNTIQGLQQIIDGCIDGKKIDNSGYVHDALPDGSLTIRPVTEVGYAYSPKAVTEIQKAAFASGIHQGVELAVEAIQKVDMAVRAVDRSVSAIGVAAVCNNGPRTRNAMERVLNNFVGAIQGLETALASVQNQQLIVFSPFDEALRFWAALRIETRNFLAAERDTDEAQVNLAAFLAPHTALVAAMYAELETASRRGSRRRAALDLIGRMAAVYPAPQPGEHWKLGLTVYEQLSAIPESARSTEQKTALGLLSPHIPIVSKGADEKQVSHKTDLGRLISRARKNYIERSRLETTSNNN